MRLWRLTYGTDNGADGTARRYFPTKRAAELESERLVREGIPDYSQRMGRELVIERIDIPACNRHNIAKLLNAETEALR